MRNLIASALTVVFLAMLTQPCLGQVPADAIDQLRIGRPNEAERSFSALQKAFENGQVTEYDLLDSYKVFYTEDRALAAGLDDWVDAFPTSSAAYLARGVYYRKRGESRRGEQYVRETPPADLRYMDSMFAKAKPDLVKSLQLNSRAYLAALHLLNIAQYESDDRAADKALATATAILPSNFLARARYTVHLTPRWGGSYARIEAFIARCKSEGVPEPALSLLKAIELEDQGHTAAEHGHTKEAIAIFERALLLSKAGGARFRKDYMRSSLWYCSRYNFGGEYCQ